MLVSSFLPVVLRWFDWFIGTPLRPCVPPCSPQRTSAVLSGLWSIPGVHRWLQMRPTHDNWQLTTDNMTTIINTDTFYVVWILWPFTSYVIGTKRAKYRTYSMTTSGRTRSIREEIERLVAQSLIPTPLNVDDSHLPPTSWISQF